MNRSFPFCSTEAAAAAAGASIPVAIDSLASAGPPLLLSISFSTAQRHQQGSLCLETLAPRFSYRGSQPEILRDQGAAGGASAESERGGWPLEEKMTCRRKQMLQIPDAALRPRVSLSLSRWICCILHSRYLSRRLPEDEEQRGMCARVYGRREAQG